MMITNCAEITALSVNEKYHTCLYLPKSSPTQRTELNNPLLSTTSPCAVDQAPFLITANVFLYRQSGISLLKHQGLLACKVPVSGAKAAF
jgi:hypothetical protein